jgi:recombination protein RecA
MAKKGEGEKKSTLASIAEEINAKFGKGAIRNMEDVDSDIEWVQSGSIDLDIALGGGYAKGRIIEIYGPESSGKTTLALHAIANVQSKGGRAAFIDAEHAFDKFYAENGIGIDMAEDKFLISQPDSGEQALNILEALLDSKGVDIVVIDSVSALTPQAEIDGMMGEQKMGLQARLMSQACRKIVSKTQPANCLVIFINQLREKIGVMFGNPETTSGGNALKFYASQRVDVRRTGSNKDGEEIVSNQVRAKVIKNKVAPPFKKAEFALRFGEGIDSVAELIQICTEEGIIKRSGAWFSYGEVKLGQGKENARDLLLDNPELTEELETKLKTKLGLI